MAPIHKDGLPRAGISSTIPSQIASLASNMWLQNPTGKLMTVAMEDIVMEMRLHQATGRWLKYGLKYTTTDSWIKHVLTFMEEQNIEIQHPSHALRAQREHDVTIMQCAIETTTDPATLRAINRLRMSLNIIWLSDMYTADVTSVDERWQIRGTTTPKRNTFQWPLHHITTSSDWTQWRKFLTSLTQQRRELGHWTCNEEEWVQNWDAFTDYTGELLFIRTPNSPSWRRHIRIGDGNRRRTQYYTEFLPTNQCPTPDLLRRTTVTTLRTHIELISVATDRHDIHIPVHHNLHSPLPKDRDLILQRIRHILAPECLEATNSIGQLLRDFEAGAAIAISDGSHFPKMDRAAGAWIVESRCRS
jgi:hypothetical protein